MELNISLTLKSRTFRYLLLALVWCQTILVQYVRAILMRLPIIGAYPDVLVMLIYAVTIVLALPEIRIKPFDLLGIVGAFIIYLLSPLFFPDTAPYWKMNASRFLTSVLPLYFVGVCIGQHEEDQEGVVRFLYKLSLLTIIARILFYYTSGTVMTEVQSRYQGDMDGAYNILPHLCLVMYYVIKKKNVVNIAVWATGSIFLLFLGTRGAVLMEVICFVLMILFFSKWKNKEIKIILIAAAVIAYLYSPLFDMTMSWLSSLASKFGLSIRIFDKFLSGTLGLTTSRDVIAEELYEALSNNLLGYGIYADWVFAGVYAHKIYLELWIHYGVIVGTIFLCVVLLMPISAFAIEKNADVRGFLIVLYCAGVLKLFLSGSYLHERWLFLLLGISVALIRRQGKNKKNLRLRTYVN